jgi:hypothetical protein
MNMFVPTKQSNGVFTPILDAPAAWQPARDWRQDVDADGLPDV